MYLCRLKSPLMIKRLYLIVLLSLPLALSAQGDIDSLFRQFESSTRNQRFAYAKQLIGVFEQEDLYDRPVLDPNDHDRKFAEMLTYLGMGLHKLDASDFPRAIKLGLTAENLVPKDSLYWLSSCYELLDVAYLRQGDNAKAIEYAQKDYDLGERLDDDRLRSTALNALAAVHCYTHQLDNALDYINRAIALERKGTDDKALAVRLGVKSEILLLMDRPDEALEAIEEAIDIDSKAGRIGKVGVRLSQKADILAHTNQWKECRKTCLQALEIFDQTGNTMDKIITLKQIGAAETHLKDYNAAEKHLLEGERLCIETGFRPQLLRIQRNLSALYKETQRPEKALYYLEQASALNEELNEERQQKIIGEYQAQFDVKEKEQELAVKQNAIRNRSILAFTGLFVALFCAAFAVYGYRLAKIHKRRNEKLAEIDNIKNQFFTIISHDMKNPVKAQAQLLGYLSSHYEEVTDDQKKQQIQALKKSGDQLVNLLTSLLDWARMETGNMSFNPIRVDLTAAVRKTIQLLQPITDEKKITISSDLDDVCHVFTDHNYVETILRNLLSNAVKFSHEGGSIEIETRRDEDKLSLSVVDHGVGMNEALQNTIFQLKRISTPGTGQETGTGLGLIVCKSLAHKAHGDLTFVSAEGKGSTFTLTLPTTPFETP